ncbi:MULTISPECIES: zinc-dependent alcohol dehydrogenase family protein [unclassified Azospirillum]|uniref:zinc-dependent alcohol dehydrogenase family protein n=1 Tax=unclassified Azospirillum TaxID=2630922 RepID=UPI000B63930A|nr:MULTISPECIES: zinc-dependent alcohol dehydrogenase family protein [unclassified Azospirillum]SNT17545.1 alcohol dehydrogenase, propanol-preferring [Azospirillum sp. RU38E]SNT29759.1 alcohol dehydrogenase, propanol-preferring [Azospirillum sp. RU37A]
MESKHPAMVLKQPGQPLVLEWHQVPAPGPGQLLIRVCACGVCRTDLHVVDGELPHPALPLVPGHEVVGRIAAIGSGVDGFQLDQRVGVPWLGWACGNCDACHEGRENLCPEARFTGYTLAGGYASHILADARFCFAIPDGYSDAAAAPLLCAGLIGYRALRMAGDGKRLGLYGFGAAAHIIAQVAKAQGRRVCAFVRPGDAAAMDFALRMGADWAGPSDAPGPEPLDAAILFAPIGALVPAALTAVKPGGRVVCAGIHMSDIPAMPYHLLWQERQLLSVANLTRQDALEFLELAGRIPLHTEIHAYPLIRANEALADLRAGAFTGAAVLLP